MNKAIRQMTIFLGEIIRDNVNRPAFETNFYERERSGPTRIRNEFLRKGDDVDGPELETNFCEAG